MNKVINNCSDIRKAFAWCDGLTNFNQIFVNLTRSKVVDYTDENNRIRYVFNSDFISKILDMSIDRVKFVSSVLYHKFRKLEITY